MKRGGKSCKQRKFINKRGTGENKKDQSCGWQNQGYKDTTNVLREKKLHHINYKGPENSI